METVIPKIIHYCWFGRTAKPKELVKCISSWKKFCPDYEIIEWNEDNFDVFRNEYTSWCYDNKKWAFLSDFVRLVVVAEHGGVYFDTDVELVSCIDGLMQYEAFYCFENASYVATGLGFGAIAGHQTLLAMIEQYHGLEKKQDGSFGLVKCPMLNTNALIPYGLVLNGTKQMVSGAVVLPSEYMNPFDPATGILSKTENTVSVHWYSAAWLSPIKRLRVKLMRPLHRIFGVDAFKRFKR